MAIKSNSAWPYGIAIFYALFVLFLIIFLVFSFYNKADLVTKDYYAQELEYQQRIDRIQHTKEMGYQISWRYDVKLNAIVIKFPKDLQYAAIQGEILLFRVSDSQLDIILPVEPNRSGIQFIPRKSLAAGNWRIEISWQNEDGKFYSEGPIFIPAGRKSGNG